MSDVPRGPDWWLASDQRWYPPESHPWYQPPGYVQQGTPSFPPPAATPYSYGNASAYVAPKLASYGQRLGGWMLDWLILLIPSWLVLALTHSVHTYHSSYGAGFHVGGVGLLLWPTIVIAYGTVMCGSWRGQTVGMMVAGTKVVRASSEKSIGYPLALWRALFEWLLAALFFLPWILDVLFPIWDQRRQSLHDKVAGTVVIRQR